MRIVVYNLLTISDMQLYGKWRDTAGRRYLFSMENVNY